MSFGKAVDLVRLAMMASGRTGICLSDVEQEFGCVRRTAQRMIDALEEAFPATEHYRGFDGRHYWRLPARAIAQLLSPSVDELVALSAACEQLELAGMTSEAGYLTALKRKVRALIPDEQSARLATDEEAMLEALGYAAKPGPQPAQDELVNGALSLALKGPFRLKISYQSRADSETSERIIEPLGLLLGTRRYLVAIDIAKRDGRFRHYRVEDIGTATVLSESFAPPADFDLQAYSQRAFGSFHNDSEYGEVVWKFGAHAAERVKRFRFHPAQTSEELDDGSIIIRFQASGHLEMAWHLYAWGGAVEVLAPPNLADLVNPARRADFPALP